MLVFQDNNYAGELITLKKFTLNTKNLLFTSILTTLIILSITTINYFLNMNATIERLSIASEQTVKAWSKDVSIKEVEAIIAHDEEQQKLAIEYFDRLAEYQPQVAQGYIFGVELVNGTGTSVITGPSFLMKDFEKSNLHVGDIYTQPQVIADAIKDMKITKKQTISRIYTDDYGKWMTVLKPLFNEQGEIFAYYGIDFDAQPYLDEEYKKIKTMLVILIVLLVIVCLIQYIFTKKIFKPIADMKVSMRKITVGDYSIRLRESTDELGKLAQQFNTMSSSVASLLTSIKENSIESSKQISTLTKNISDANQTRENMRLNVAQLTKTMHEQKLKTTMALPSTQDFSHSVDSIIHKTQAISDFLVTLEREAKAGIDALNFVQKQMNDAQTNEMNQSLVCIEQTFKNILGQTTLFSNTIQELLSATRTLTTKKQEVATIFEQLNHTTSENQLTLGQLNTQLQTHFDSFQLILAETKILHDTLTELEVLIYTFKN